MAMSGLHQRQMTTRLNHRTSLLPIHGVGSLVRGHVAAVWSDIETALARMRKLSEDQARADYGDTKW